MFDSERNILFSLERLNSAMEKWIAFFLYKVNDSIDDDIKEKNQLFVRNDLFPTKNHYYVHRISRNKTNGRNT